MKFALLGILAALALWFVAMSRERTIEPWQVKTNFEDEYPEMQLDPYLVADRLNRVTQLRPEADNVGVWEWKRSKGMPW